MLASPLACSLRGGPGESEAQVINALIRQQCIGHAPSAVDSSNRLLRWSWTLWCC